MWLRPDKLSLAEDRFFFLTSPKFGQKNRLNLSEDRLKSGSRSFDVAHSLQNSPPFQIPGYAPEHSCPWPREGLPLASDIFVFFALA